MRALMAVEVRPVVVRDVFATCCYFVVEGDSGHGVLVDAGAQPELLARTAAQEGWSIDAILLTHAHFDHFAAAAQLSRAWRAPVRVHRESSAYLEDPLLNLSGNHGRGITLAGTRAFDDGMEFPIGGGAAKLRAIHTPGHTPDSVTYHCPDAGVAFVGDTVYEGGAGLTVFPGGDPAALARSIERLKRLLPPETLLLSGHSQPIAMAQL